MTKEEQQLKDKLTTLGRERVEEVDRHSMIMQRLYEEERQALEELNACS